jgi:hypothetical protein
MMKSLWDFSARLRVSAIKIPFTDSATLKKWECRDSDIRLHFVPARRAGEASAFIGFRRDELAEAVSRYHLPDFSNWQHPAAFARAFARLDLRTSLR